MGGEGDSEWQEGRVTVSGGRVRGDSEWREERVTVSGGRVRGDVSGGRGG